MNVTAYANDQAVLKLADAAGCGLSLRESAAKPNQVTIIAHDTLFISHGAGEGYSAFRVDDPRDMPVLLAKLAPIIGPVQSARVAAHDSHCSRTETRH